MQWASAILSEKGIEDCVAGTVEQIRSQLGDKTPHLTLLFVSPHFKEDYGRIPALIRDRMDPGLLIGCSGGGIIGGGREVEQKAAFSLTCAHLPGVDLREIRADTLKLPGGDTAPSVWRDWLGVPVEQNPHFIFLADPFSFQAEDFLAGIDFAYAKAGKVGGLASGAHFQGGNVLYLGDKIHHLGLVGVALSGNIELETIVAQGCRPIGKPMSISQCDDTLLMEIEGKSPLQVLEEIVDTMSEYDRKLMQTSLFLGIEMDPLKENPGQGDFLIRNLMGVDRSTGALSIGSMLRPGQLVQFHLRDKLMSAEDLNLLLTRYRDKGQKTPAAGALLFSCLGRGEYLYGRPNHDSDLFREKIGEVPLGGFFCNGEIGPVGQSTFLHGYTSSFGIFRPAQQQA